MNFFPMLAYLLFCAWIIQPIDIYAAEGKIVIIKTEKTKANAMEFWILMSKNETGDTALILHYPEYNNWSKDDRKELPFPKSAQHLSAYFGEKIPKVGCGATIYYAKRRWTGDFTWTDKPIADLRGCRK
ncbi:MAG: hypothetical protein V1661_00250 [bacterium]